ncbi:glycine oxidase ThiO [Arthrobacter sp. R1-13]
MHEPVSGTDISVDVAVIGGGVVGHAIAWEAALSGRSVVLIDDAPGTGASWAAAGMLAPVTELHYQEEDLLELMLEASALWPAFAAGLAPAIDSRVNGPSEAEASGTGYLTTPTLVIGADAADRRALEDLRRVQAANGLTVEPLTVREARSIEPLLSPAVSGAYRIAADHQVDPRRLLARIAEALADPQRSGGTCEMLPARAAGLRWDGDRVAGVVLDNGRAIHAGETVLASGLGTGKLDGLPPGLDLPLRPVYGDIIRLRVPGHLQPLLTSTVRGMVHGVPVYIVPRDDGTVVIGATQREAALEAGAAEAAVSAGGIYQLLRDAQVLLPAVAELELLECTARGRPGTPDNAPLLGRVRDRTGDADLLGLIVATGFFRHGILLAPAAASICLQLMEGRSDSRWAVFEPGRFSPGSSAGHVRRHPDPATAGTSPQ